MWNCPRMSATQRPWWYDNIKSGNHLVPSGNTPLTETIIIYHATRSPKTQEIQIKDVFYLCRDYIRIMHADTRGPWGLNYSSTIFCIQKLDAWKTTSVYTVKSLCFLKREVSRLLGNLACCSNYIFSLDLTHGFKTMHICNYKTRRETFTFWDLVRLILDILPYVQITNINKWYTVSKRNSEEEFSAQS